jgi:peptidoglycan/xylan/chitin deacetylase (PgdA/CDA1 family)
MKHKLIQSLRPSFERLKQRLANRWPWQLRVLLYHGLYDDTCSCPPTTADPSVFQPLSKLRSELMVLKAQGYTFISPEETFSVMGKRGKFALLTFDDGYANNLLALPLLQELQVPAVFFVCSWHIENQKAFWWDVVFRELVARNVSSHDIGRRRREMKKLPWRVQLSELDREFGIEASLPVSLNDRPMTADELATFAVDPLVTIGNHTQHHAILPLLDEAGARQELQTCQDSIAAMCGYRPSMLAYPNGSVNGTVAEISRNMGFKAAFTTVARPVLSFGVVAPCDSHLIPRLQPR